MDRWRILLVLAAGLVLTACAGGPRFQTAEVNLGLTPAEAAAGGHSGERVLWGGVIIASHNYEDRTEIEVLGYPLSAGQRPETSGTAQGRFLVEHQGYLETVDYAPGRLLTAVGVLDEPRVGRVGERPYTYPVMRAQDLYLWPIPSGDGGSRVHFGIGIGIFR